MYRNQTKKIKVGSVVIGGGNKIAIQSMTNTKTEQVKDTVKQIHLLEKAGCDIIRVAVPTMKAAEAIKEIKKQIHIPLVADIHFDYQLAIKAVENGADKIRINPGNIGNDDRLKQVVECCKAHGIPIRVGVNSGSLETEVLSKYGKTTAEGLVESAIKNVRRIEEFGFHQIVVSIKSSDIMTSVQAHRLAANQIEYPLHIGITESGTIWSGTIKSSVGLGIILADGIGDTIRVSLTGDPVEEVRVAKKILQSINLLHEEIEFVSCPTCGRTNIDLIQLANEAERRCESIHKPIKVAVMGCAVNGPGEAKEADIGIAGGKGEGIIFKKGKIIRKVKENELLDALLKEIEQL